MDGPYADAVRVLASGSPAAVPAPNKPPSFQALPTGVRPLPATAVDGSHAVLLDNGAFWVVAISAAAITWPRPSTIPAQASIVAIRPSDAQARLDAEYSKWGTDAPSARDADQFAAALRQLAEARTALDAVRQVAPGQLLLLDGALHGLPPAAASLLQPTLEAARDQGVLVAGVAKRSGLEQDGHAVVPLLHRLGKQAMGRTPWFVALEDRPGVTVACLHGQSPHAFRIDVQGERVLQELVPHARDAVYVGYPYPLAAAHNYVALTAGRVAQLKDGLDSALRKAGGGAAQAAHDFHEVLDRNV